MASASGFSAASPARSGALSGLRAAGDDPPVARGHEQARKGKADATIGAGENDGLTHVKGSGREEEGREPCPAGTPAVKGGTSTRRHCTTRDGHGAGTGGVAQYPF